MPDKKLTPEQVEEILAMKAEMEALGLRLNYRKLGIMYGVSGPTIRRNVEPNENDVKRRPARKYDPEVAKAQRETYRTYQFHAYKKSESDKRIIEKLESVDNKQRYIKNLILQDIVSGEGSSPSAPKGK